MLLSQQKVSRSGQGEQPAALPAAKWNVSGRVQLSNADTLSNAQKQRSSTNVPTAKHSSRQDLSANVISEHDSDDEPFFFSKHVCSSKRAYRSWRK